MNKYTLFFGYIFYRINSIYRKVSKLAEDQQPAAIISIIQTVFVMDLFILVYTTLVVDIKSYRMPSEAMLCFFVIALIMYFINLKLLIRRYWEFDKLWREEPKLQKRKRGWFIIISFALIFFFGVIYFKFREVLGI